MGRMRSRTRLLQALIGLQALLVASPIATIDNLLTSPRAVGAQGRRADLPATIASGLPFVVALLPVTMVAVAVALHRRTPGSRRAAAVLSVVALVVALAPGQRGMTTAAPIVHGIPLAVVAAATLLVLWRSRAERTRELGRSRAGRVTVVLLTVWVLVLAALGASSRAIPVGPLSSALSTELDVDRVTPQGELAGEPAEQSPQLAPNPDSNIHGDAAMTDTYTDRDVLDPRQARVIRRHLGGVCASVLRDEHERLVAVCVNATRVTLNVLDPDTLDVLAREHVADRPFRADFATNFAGGGYAVLDADQRVVLPTSDGRITRWRVADDAGDPQIAPVDEFDISDGLADGEGINSAVPGTDGRIWVVGQLGSVGLLDPETGRAGWTRFEAADIENSFAVGADGRAWVVTSRELVALSGESGTPRVVWEQTYDAGSRRKPGQTSRASGTTPTLMAGERHVAITDNADPRMHVVVYDTSAGAGDKEVCRVPVFAPDRSAGDNSLIAIGRSLFVESNYGYNLFDATFGRSTQPGLTRIDVTDDGCEVVWANDEIRIPSTVSKGTSSGVIATYTKEESAAGIDAWYFTAVDATTGEIMWRRLAGTGSMVNNHYAATYVGPDGSMLVGVTGGLVALVPEQP